MVNFPMKSGISFHHEGLVYCKLLWCSFLQLLPHGQCHVGGTPRPPPHINGGGLNLMSLTVGPEDHCIIWRVLDIGGQAQPPSFMSASGRVVCGVLDVNGVKHT